MCDSMAASKLWSTFGGFGRTETPTGPTFGPKNTSFLPPFVMNICPPNNPFVYCWGAECMPDPQDPKNRAICKCPFVAFPKGAVIAIWDGECDEQVYHSCAFTHNGGPRGTPIEEFISEQYKYVGCSDVGGLIPTCEVKTEPTGYKSMGPLDSRVADLQKVCGVTLDECATGCDGFGDLCDGFTCVSGYKTGYQCCYTKRRVSVPLSSFRSGDIGGTFMKSVGVPK
ncbi:hypothetical protein FOA52_006497 [Chlamydomonas sp. UWO 241]|nr:hypothetical protein FOA52_006497 [Chlamydomonas sp. UWO 241]